MSTHYLGELRRAGGGLVAGLLALMAAATAMAQSVTIDFVTVGYAGNAADSLTGLGSVNYQYQIGKYEVTNAQYAAFLNAVAKHSDPYALYNTEMGSHPQGGISRSGNAGNYTYAPNAGYENKPVVFVSWWDAARFANWAGTGETEGTLAGAAYKLNGGFPSGVAREANAVVALPTQDEWYKAAYYDPAKGGTGGYWLYPTRSDAAPAGAVPLTGGNAANFFGTNGYAVTQAGSIVSNQVYLTDKGSYPGAGSFFGTFDQGGNVWEWNTTLFGSSRGLRGGSWFHGETDLRASAGLNLDPAYELDSALGFRVASLAPIPEPSTYAALAGLASLGVALWRRRAGRGTASA